MPLGFAWNDLDTPSYFARGVGWRLGKKRLLGHLQKARSKMLTDQEIEALDRAADILAMRREMDAARILWLLSEKGKERKRQAILRDRLASGEAIG